MAHVMGETGQVDAALEDASAIAALQCRDEVGVAQLVHAWTPSMLRLARAHTVSDASAEDASTRRAQEVVVAPGLRHRVLADPQMGRHRPS